MPDVLGFKVSLERADENSPFARLIFKGQFKTPIAEKFPAEVKRLLQHGMKTLEIDLTELTYLDSAGLSAFAAADQLLRAHGGSLKIVNPRRLVRHIFTCAHLDKHLDIGPAQESG